jgi:enamine deaminase RidA (YjgF/YER057c/UK114 family)
VENEILQPAGWPRPRGYANAIAGRGRMVFISGQVGWDAQGRFTSEQLAGQAGQAFRNIATLLGEAGGVPGHLVRLTWYVTDIQAYRDQAREIGAAYREVFGKAFPTMALVQVSALVEREALVEIEATALIPD